MTFSIIDPAAVARDEETRVARAVADTASESRAWCGGFMCRDHAGTWANMALGCALRGEHVTGQDVSELIDWYASAGIEPQVQACAYSHPSLVRRLGEGGFVLKELELVLAGHPAAPDRSPWSMPERVRIERVPADNADAVERFAAVASRGFLDDREDPIQLDLMERAARHERAINLLAYLDDAPAGAASLDIWGDLAGLYLGAVLPVARRRGIQLALMHARLDLAAASDCRLATVGTLPGVATERNARRCGMSPCYTRVALVRPGPGLVSSS